MQGRHNVASTVIIILVVCVLFTLASFDEVPMDHSNALLETTESKPNITESFSTNNQPQHISSALISEIIALRHEIHRNAELGGQEVKTAKLVFDYVSRFAPDDYLTEVGGTGLLFLFKMGSGNVNRKVILYRADMDALPIVESLNSPANRQGSDNYLSTTNGVFHGCGHDGHTAVVAGLASVLRSIQSQHENSTNEMNGDIILLFQPAEETGKGALSMVNDPRFATFAGGILNRVDAAFAFHNLPGFESKRVLLRKGTFAAASRGVQIELKGMTSHASQPEMGRSPASALAQIIHNLEQLADKGSKKLLPQFHDFILLTIVHAHLGSHEPAYGVTPGEGRVMVTIRTYRDEDMATLVQEVRNIVAEACVDRSLTHEIMFHDEFAATRNENENTDLKDSLIEQVRRAAMENMLDTMDMGTPFRWSEDFGNFNFPGTTYFGIGAGMNYPALHNDDYDFPDDLTLPALSMFSRLAENLMSNRK